MRQLARERTRVEHVREGVVGRELLQPFVRLPQLRQAGDRHADHREIRELVNYAIVERRRGGHLIDPHAEAQQRRRDRERDAPVQSIVPRGKQHRYHVQDPEAQVTRRARIQDVHAPRQQSQAGQPQRAAHAWA